MVPNIALDTIIQPHIVKKGIKYQIASWAYIGGRGAGEALPVGDKLSVYPEFLTQIQ